jgi:Pyruvate/2-oxoacid:ferredoxin oxidoreductase gamma subunit
LTDTSWLDTEIELAQRAGSAAAGKEETMATKAKGGLDAEITAFGKRIAGANKHLSGTLMVGGQKMTATQLIGTFQASLDADTALEKAEKTVSDARKAQKAAEKNAQALDKSLKSFLEGAWGKDSSDLGDFGYPVTVRKQSSVATKAAAVAKANATKAAKKGK